MSRKLIATIVAMLLAAVSLAACANDSETVSHNLSQDADNFKVHRRVVFFNGITDKYLLSIEGYCSITDEGNQLEVTCKVGESTYKKHFLGLSDNVSYFVEQLEPIESDPYHYKVVFKPETIVPDVEPHTSDG
ncbi:hypothetical protein EUA66_04790 [TM7 phylum sp. oral taxon 349]|nr:hypothetical protein EUA66_04790 [TM7 phylum sp. oral taxon 349]